MHDSFPIGLTLCAGAVGATSGVCPFSQVFEQTNIASDAGDGESFVIVVAR
ncbi:hypothetical protein [Corynebacterium rouxii]|uniref:hypothetical protein n=1 Tax=Corynebacterium rouxii TaxID=2719119 RepID=UPI0012DEDFBF|nr:hypothetical protein [Corynebacterium rouxii]